LSREKIAFFKIISSVNQVDILYDLDYNKRMKNYKNKNLKGKDFSNQNLAGADFSGSDLRGTNFKGSNLKGCKFDKTKGAKKVPCLGKYEIVIFDNVIAVGCLQKTREDWLSLSFEDCQKLYKDITVEIWKSIRSAIDS
jgi:hypothetical protein